MLSNPTFNQVSLSVCCSLSQIFELYRMSRVLQHSKSSKSYVFVCHNLHLFLYRRNARHLGEDEDPLTQCVRQGGEEPKTLFSESAQHSKSKWKLKNRSKYEQ